MKYNRKIIFLAIFLMTAPMFLPYGFNSGRKSAKENMVSHAELCCCGDDVTTCRDCCCSVDYPRAVSDYYTESDGLQGSDDTGKRLFIINACGGGSHDIFVAPELNYFVSLSAFQNYLPVNISNEPLTLIRKDHILTPPYKPPKS